MPAVLPDREGRLCVAALGPDGSLTVETRDLIALGAAGHHASDSRPCRRAFERYLHAGSTCPVWKFGGRAFDLTSRVLVMGIVNVTPDSFYDGGVHYAVDAAVKAGVTMAESGADIIDVGGESTRPGADAVSPEEELRRVLPVVTELASRGITVSSDTRHPEVAKQTLRAGAQIINDVGGFRDAGMVSVLAESSAGAVVMHMRGHPQTMQRAPEYRWVTGEVAAYLAQSLDRLVDGGVAEERVMIDPGIGFGKELEHNLELLREIGSLLCIGRPVMVGVSRKSFIGRILDVPPEHRLEGSIAAATAAVLRGARMVRTHDVIETGRAMRVIQHLL